MATVLIAPADQDTVERVRQAANTFAGEVGVSAWNGFAVARFCAKDAAALRARRDEGAGADRCEGAAATVAELMG